MLKKYRILIIVIFIVFALIYFNPGPISPPVEKMDILSGIGIDLDKDNAGQKEYLLSMSTYTFSEKEKINSMILSGTGMTIPETRASRQLQSNHKLLIALQKVIIMSEEVSRFGIGNIMDILFANQFMNEMGWAVVSKGKTLDILKQKVDEYPSSSDYIDGLIENCKEYNFFSDNYKIMDMYVRVDEEGRNLVLPYIETVNDKVQITGLALFKKDRMVRKIDINEAKLLNMLREDKVKGMLELRKNLKEYISIYGQSKRKVSCQKSGSKYSFTIDLNYEGDIVSNTLIKDLEKNQEVISKYEQEIAQKIQKQCQGFIDRMKDDYRVDCLELGRVAAAKYGRDTGVDWDKIVSEADIKVNVKVTLLGFGRGRYAEIK